MKFSTPEEMANVAQNNEQSDGETVNVSYTDDPVPVAEAVERIDEALYGLPEEFDGVKGWVGGIENKTSRLEERVERLEDALSVRNRQVSELYLALDMLLQQQGKTPAWSWASVDRRGDSATVTLDGTEFEDV